MGVLELSVDRLDLGSVVAVVRRGARVAFDDEARERVRGSRRLVERMTDDVRPVYGVTTGFGGLATTRIPPDEHLKL